MRADFYIIDSQTEHELLLFVCRLAEKSYLHQQSLYIQARDQKQAHQIDELLWTFKEDSFLPHNITGEGPYPPPMIQIGYQPHPMIAKDVIINLDSQVPALEKRHGRVIEIIPQIEALKQEGRLKYRHYQQQQFTLNTHTLYEK